MRRQLWMVCLVLLGFAALVQRRALSDTLVDPAGFPPPASGTARSVELDGNFDLVLPPAVPEQGTRPDGEIIFTIGTEGFGVQGGGNAGFLKKVGRLFKGDYDKLDMRIDSSKFVKIARAYSEEARAYHSLQTTASIQRTTVLQNYMALVKKEIGGLDPENREAWPGILNAIREERLWSTEVLALAHPGARGSMVQHLRRLEDLHRSGSAILKRIASKFPAQAIKLIQENPTVGISAKYSETDQPLYPREIYEGFRIEQELYKLCLGEPVTTSRFVPWRQPERDRWMQGGVTFVATRRERTLSAPVTFSTVSRRVSRIQSDRDQWVSNGEALVAKHRERFSQFFAKLDAQYAALKSIFAERTSLPPESEFMGYMPPDGGDLIQWPPKEKLSGYTGEVEELLIDWWLIPWEETEPLKGVERDLYEEQLGNVPKFLKFGHTLYVPVYRLPAGAECPLGFDDVVLTRNGDSVTFDAKVGTYAPATHSSTTGPRCVRWKPWTYNQHLAIRWKIEERKLFPDSTPESLRNEFFGLLQDFFSEFDQHGKILEQIKTRSEEREHALQFIKSTASGWRLPSLPNDPLPPVAVPSTVVLPLPAPTPQNGNGVPGRGLPPVSGPGQGGGTGGTEEPTTDSLEIRSRLDQ